METGITREAALALLKEYNKEPFHLRHALTVEAVMDWYAARLDPENREFWSLVGLLHDIDFESGPWWGFCMTWISNAGRKNTASPVCP